MPYCVARHLVYTEIVPSAPERGSTFHNPAHVIAASQFKKSERHAFVGVALDDGFSFQVHSHPFSRAFEIGRGSWVHPEPTHRQDHRRHCRVGPFAARTPPSSLVRRRSRPSPIHHLCGPETPKRQRFLQDSDFCGRSD